MAKKTGRVAKKRKRTTPRDLRSRKPATVKGGSYPYTGFVGGVRVASGDVDNEGGPSLKLAK
jgi:hypothetical protein